MKILYKNRNTGLQYWQIKLRSDNTVTINSGYLSLSCDGKQHKFKDANSAEEFYLERVLLMSKEYNFVPWTDEIMVGVRVNKHHEPKLDLAEHWQEIQEVIVYNQLDTPKMEVRERKLLESVYWVKTLAVEIELTLDAIRKYMLKYGEAEVMLIH